MRHLILCSVMWLCGLMMAVGQNVPQVIPDGRVFERGVLVADGAGGDDDVAGLDV